MSFTKTASLAAAATATAFLTGCAPMISGAMNIATTEETILKKTADYFATTPDKVKISHINKGPLATEYRAQVGKNLNICKIYYGAVECRKIER